MDLVEDLVKRWKLLAPAALIPACGLFDEPAADGLPAGNAELPDIVLVSIDTLRADHLSSYGHTRETSPFLDELAREGVRFAHARSASPWTLPAHTTMLTGQLPMTHKVVEDHLRLDASTPVLPELLQARGYETAGIVATLYVSRVFGFERGFDHFEDFELHTEKRNLRGEVVAEDVVDEALEWWAERAPGEPVFLFLHVYDVHYEYDPPEPYASMFDRPPQEGDPRYKNYFHFKKKPVSAEQFEHQLAQYDESIRYVDDQLRRLDQAAEAAGRKVRWVVTSDHGEEFGERGSWGHAHTLYAEQLHVPLIMSGAGLPAGTVIDGTVGTQDIAPTLAALTGQAGELRADGLDLHGVMAGTEALEERPFPAETTRFKTNRLALYQDGLRLEWDLKSNKAELFEPAGDPRELTDLAPVRPDELARMKRALTDLLGAPWEARAAGTVKPEEAVVLHEGTRLGSMAVAEGTDFLVLPYDASVRFETPEGEALGPFAAQGSVKRPGEGDPLRVDLGSTTGDVALDDEMRAALEAIGYMQGGEDDEAGEDEAPEEPGAPDGADGADGG